MDKHKYIFVIFLLFCSFSMRGQDLTTAEYFIDNDPGAGEGQAISFTSSTSADFVFDVVTTGLDAGFHKVYVRFKNADEEWGLFEGRSFYIQPEVTLPTAGLLEFAEYFFDTDPGVGNGNPIAIASDSHLNFTFDAATAGLSEGFHKVYVRFKNSHENWGVFEGRTFYIQPEIQTQPTPQIVEVEYYFDSYVACGQGYAIPVTPATAIDDVLDFNVSSLDVGSHTVYVRVKDSNNLWSYASFESITVEEATSSKDRFEYGLSIYPIPANSWLNIELEDINAQYISIVNQYGQIVMLKSTVDLGRLIQIDVSRLATGVYMLNVVSENQVVSRKIIIK